MYGTDFLRFYVKLNTFFKKNNIIGKKEWPELVGMDGEEAAKKIREENPGLDVSVLQVGSPVTLDFRTDRVRIFVDCNGKVAQPPTIG